jgi:outer membrane receptor protein involved in Fe transport
VAHRSYSTQVPAGQLRFIGGNFDVLLRATSYTRTTPYINAFNVFTGDFDVPNPERDRMVSLDIKHRASLSSTAQLSTRLYGDVYDYLQRVRSSAPEDCGSTYLSGCRSIVLGYSRWAGVDVAVSNDWLADGVLISTLGIDARLRKVGGKNDTIDTATGLETTDLEYTALERLIGVYFQQEISPHPRLDLNAGLRFDNDQRFGSKLSPRVAAAVKLWSGATLKGIYAEAFRGPTSYESNYTDFLSQIPAPDLSPESVRSVEASLEQRVGTQRFLVGAFRSWWNDMVLLETVSDSAFTDAVAAGILPAGSTEALQYRNVSSIDNYGVNAAYEGLLGVEQLRYGLNVTAARSARRAAGGSIPLTVAPQLFGNARVAYDLGGGRPTLALAAGWFSRRPADRAFDGGFDPQPHAPPQLELRAAITGPLGLKTGLSFRGTVGYAFSGRMPYVAGPIQAATPTMPSAELAPVDRLRFGLGLQLQLE